MAKNSYSKIFVSSLIFLVILMPLSLAFSIKIPNTNNLNLPNFKLISRLTDGTKYYYHDDHLGSTSLITDDNGNVVENEFYSPFGESLTANNAEKNKLYAGQFKDGINCQYYYGARYYNQCNIIFINPDHSIAYYNPQSFNHYGYSLNNPYKYKDDSGNNPLIVAGAVGAIAVGGINLGVQLWHNHGDFTKVNYVSSRSL